MSKGRGTTESDSVRKRTLRTLFLAAVELGRNNMRTRVAIAAVALTFIPAIAAADEHGDAEQIRRASALFVVQAFNPKLFSLKDLYSAVSEEYKKSQNEFERQKLEHKYKSETISYINELRNKKSFFVSIPIRLSEYDFARSGFVIKPPTGLTSSSINKDDGDYYRYDAQKISSVSVKIDNFKNDIFLPMPVSEAEKMAPILSVSRTANLIVLGTVSGAAEERSIYTKTIVISMKAKKALVTLETGKGIGKHSF